MVLFYITAGFFILGLLIVFVGMLCKIGKLHRHFHNKSYEILEGSSVHERKRSGNINITTTGTTSLCSGRICHAYRQVILNIMIYSMAMCISTIHALHVVCLVCGAEPSHCLGINSNP